MMQAGSQ